MKRSSNNQCERMFFQPSKNLPASAPSSCWRPCSSLICPVGFDFRTWYLKSTDCAKADQWSSETRQHIHQETKNGIGSKRSMVKNRFDRSLKMKEKGETELYCLQKIKLSRIRKPSTTCQQQIANASNSGRSFLVTKSTI